MRFLAVDDDPLFLQLLTLRMQGLGYTDLVTVPSGAEALTLLKSPLNGQAAGNVLPLTGGE